LKREVSSLLAIALVLTMLVIPAVGARAAIVNSLRGFDRDEPGWSGSVDGSYGASGGNTDQSTFMGSARLQWKGTLHIGRLIGTGKRTTNDGIETARATLAHLRHNYLLSERWATVAFLQLQENPFQRLDERFLAGLGGRWRAVKGKTTLIYLGATYMFEKERIQGEDGFDTANRLSSFASLELELRAGLFIDFLVFYQPRLDDFADWRAYGEIRLEVELVGSLSLFTGYNLQYDSKPPAGVEETDWNTKTGFLVKF
jgi:putative salt-induced outer membrane protein YdiY